MENRILKWLYDIKLAIDEIDSFFIDEVMVFKSYQKNVMRKRAVERNLEIIGEATNRIIKRNPTLANEIKDTNAIIGLRNQVIHAYDNISDEIIWSIIINHLPVLKKDIIALLDNN